MRSRPTRKRTRSDVANIELASETEKIDLLQLDAVLT